TNPSGGLKVLITRRAKDSGLVVWSRKFVGTIAHSLVADAHGDVLAVLGQAGGSSANIVKLGRGTGNNLWKKGATFDPGSAIATTPTGDLVVGGRSSASADPTQARVWVYDTATGNERWHAAIGAGSDVRVATTSTGDVFATANSGAVLATIATR